MRIPPRRWATACFVLALALGSVRAESAEPLLLVDTPFQSPATPSLYTVDPATGALTLRATVPGNFGPILGLAAADDRNLYGTGTDNDGLHCAPGLTFACLLLRIELPEPPGGPASVTVIGEVRTAGGPVGELAGLSFRNDGRLYGLSQLTHGLYVIDPTTAQAEFVGTSDVAIYGGDLAFDLQDRLWMWTNTVPLEGLYEMDPETASTLLVDPEPGLRLVGLAMSDAGLSLRGVNAPDNLLVDIDPVVGLTGVQHSLTLGGSDFDLSRGDMSSPFCPNDAACDDGDGCTTDRCSPGGCRNLLVDATCDGFDDDCDGLVDEDFPAESTVCGVGACASTGTSRCIAGAPEDDCTPTAPALDDSLCNGIDDDCDGLVDEDADADLDGLPDCVDNCPATPNIDQTDSDSDGQGDACDVCPLDPENDADGDGVCADIDCRPAAYGSSTLPGEVPTLRFPSDRSTLDWDGAEQAHVYRVYRSETPAGQTFSGVFTCLEADLTHRSARDSGTPSAGTLWSYLVAGENGCGEGGLGDAAYGPRSAPSDPCSSFSGSDTDGDGIEDRDDVCPALADAGQADADRDWVGDGCDACPVTVDFPQRDADGDGAGDACDVCPADPLNDADADGFCREDDNCPDATNPGQEDLDGDGAGDVCDACPADAANDADRDGYCGDVDNCPTIANPMQSDLDGDGAGDVCDACPADAANDADGDGYCGDVDNCAAIPNADQADDDLDGIGDVCDNCSTIANPFQENSDGDVFGDACDNCPNRNNADQADADLDGVGNACDNCQTVANPDQLNSDSDSIGDACDNCPFVHNPNQKDRDGDGIGDACDPTP